MTAVQKPINGRKFVTFSQGKIAARKYAREQARLRNSLSRGFQKKLLTVFNRTIKKATESLNNQQIPQIGVISQSFQEELTATVKTQVRRVYSTIYEANYKRYQEVSQKAEGDPFDFRRSADFERAVGMYFLGRENMMVGITDTTARQILDRIEKLRGEDNTLDQIARQLPKEFAQVNRRRANVIARTETHSAAGYANHDYYSQASDSYGIQMLKQWVATSDARTRQQHSLMNGAKVPMDEDFIMPNGARMGFTGDSKGGAVHVINCRCVTLYHEPEDIVDDVTAVEPAPDEEELRLGEDGLPIPISEAKFFEEIQQGKRTGKTARANISDSVERAAQAEMYGGDASYTRIFSRRSPADYGKNKLPANMVKTELGSETLMMIEEVDKELRLLAEKFKVPPIRGYKSTTRARLNGSMGDGVMVLNPRNMNAMGGPNKQISTWKQGDPSAEKPQSAGQFFSTKMGSIRRLMYHEFAHHVHQMKYFDPKTQSYGLSFKNRPIDSFLRGQESTFGGKIREGLTRRDVKNSPSKYGETKGVEWFAENFAVWATRKKELVDPKFKELIEDILKD